MASTDDLDYGLTAPTPSSSPRTHCALELYTCHGTIDGRRVDISFRPELGSTELTFQGRIGVAVMGSRKNCASPGVLWANVTRFKDGAAEVEHIDSVPENDVLVIVKPSVRIKCEPQGMS